MWKIQRCVATLFCSLALAGVKQKARGSTEKNKGKISKSAERERKKRKIALFLPLLHNTSQFQSLKPLSRGKIKDFE
jgi:hypothetical protein